MELPGIIILAGGKSTRMGEDKGLMPLFGKSMISYVLDRALEINSEIIIVSDNANYKKFGYPVVKDVFKEKGPLAGMYSGLINSNIEKNIVLSCDIPYIRSGLLKYLFYQSEGFDITIPVHKERIHPLIGIYSKKCADHFKKCIELDKLKITNAFEPFNTNMVDVDEFDDIAFKNLNSKKDIIPLK